MRVNVYLSDVELEKVVKINNRLDYYEIAMTLLYTGTEYQRKTINWYMENYTGKKRTEAIREFIEIGIEIGQIEVY